MSKIDNNLLKILSADGRFDSGIVGTLGVTDKTTALVKVRNPLQLIRVERRFHVVGEYPFIRSLAVECGLDEAIALERMAEVEYVSGESRVSCLSNGDENDSSDFETALSQSTSAFAVQGCIVCSYSCR